MTSRFMRKVILLSQVHEFILVMFIFKILDLMFISLLALYQMDVYHNKKALPEFTVAVSAVEPIDLANIWCY